MSELIKMKGHFKRFGAFKGLVEQKNVFISFVCKLGLFWHSWAFKTVVSLAFNDGPLVRKKAQLHTNSLNKLLFSIPQSFLISLHPFHMCSIVSLSSLHILHLLSSPSIQYLFSVSSFPHLNLAIIFLSFALSLQVLRNFLCHTPCSIWIL
jgi:hypothetical protein